MGNNSTDWKFDVPTSGSKRLPPDPRYVEALSSQGYGFEIAVADLVDNSIDAGARDVVIHFLRDGDQLVSLLIVDDGHGMDDAALDVAMTVGGRRDYGDSALGMFGTGLKAASLSLAESLTVISRTRRTRAAGRRLVGAGFQADFQCDVVDTDYCQSLMDRYYDKPITWHGTVVRWDGVKDFPKHGGTGQTDRYLTKVINRLGLHLGLHLHRFLERDDFNITIAVEDVRTRMVYLNYGVEPLNPFGYPVSGAPGYPREFEAELDGLGTVRAVGHIWPPKSSLDEYRAVGSVQDRQGFYFYRNDRLVQAGGWNGYRQAEAHLSLARVAVDLPPGMGDVFRLTVKKSGVDTSPAFPAALEQATADDGRTFRSFVEDADQVYRTARKRTATARKAVIPPGRGLAPEVRRVIEDEIPVLPGEEPIAILWGRLAPDQFFELDREERTIVLNQHYRAALLGGRRGGLNDVPMVKSLVYLLLHQVFEKEYSGSREKDNLLLWQNILVSAARNEQDRFDRSEH
ncbi:ATP-binding protein [Kitasatospora sp. NPDC047058]|uniref:ATP-binding protein n=1 Tax=Kitasatospora sp. NPDC047058 TaxID=3155620 RepID=UPI0033F3F0FF